MQLNVWFLIKRTDVEFIARGLERALSEGASNVDKKEDINKLNEVFRSFIESLIHESFSESISEVGPKYKMTIEALAKHYPMLAYKVGGKQIIYDYLNTIEKYFEKVKEKLGGIATINPNGNVDVFNIIQEKIKPFVYKEALETIEADIKMISWQIGLVDYLQVRKLLKSKPEEKILSEYVKKVNAFFASLA